MSGSRWHAPQSILLFVLMVAVIGTAIVGLLLTSAPSASAPDGARTQEAAGDRGGPVLDRRWSTPVQGGPDPRSAGVVLGTSGRALRQRTMLLMVRGEDGLVTNAVLLATSDPRHPATALLIPPGLLVPTPAWTPLAETASLTDPRKARDALSLLLGVRIDGSLVLDRLALAAMVDGIGGVPAKVERSLTVVTADGVVVSIPAGSRVLDGVVASNYAVALPSPNAEPDRISRFTSVLRSILRDLPTEPEALGQLVLSLGSLARSTQTNEESVSILGDLSRDSRAGDMNYLLLPTVAVRGGGPMQVDLDRATGLMRANMPDAVLKPGQAPGVRVVLAAAGASAGQVAMAQASLEAAGMTVIEAGPAPMQQPTTAVMIAQDSPQALALGEDVATTLGLRTGTVVVVPSLQDAPEVVVWLGWQAPTLASGTAPAV